MPSNISVTQGSEDGHFLYTDLLRIKIPRTLPSGLLDQSDRVHINRSALLEGAARECLARVENYEPGRSDLEIIDRNADRLNREAMGTLEYQQLP